MSYPSGAASAYAPTTLDRLMGQHKQLRPLIPDAEFAQLKLQTSNAVARAVVNGIIADQNAQKHQKEAAAAGGAGYSGSALPPTVAGGRAAGPPPTATFDEVAYAASRDPKARVTLPPDDTDKHLSISGSIRSSVLAKGSHLLSTEAGCPGLLFLLDWVEGLDLTAAPRVALAVHLQRTAKGFGLQIGYSTDLRRLVVEGVYEFVQSSNGWPVCRGDILTAVDKYPLPPNNNGQWLIDNVVRTFGSITHQTRVSFHRPVTHEHSRLLGSVRQSVVRLLRLEKYAMKYYPAQAVAYMRALLARLNSTYIGVYTRPCGALTMETKAGDDPATSEVARLAEWGSLASALLHEAARLEAGLYTPGPGNTVPTILTTDVAVTTLGTLHHPSRPIGAAGR